MIRIYLHSELSRAHSSHGVDRDEYDQYASYCTRKLSRLRHSGAVRRELLHSRAYKNSLSTRRVTASDENGGGGGKSRHAYRAIDITNLPPEVLITSPNYFLVPLYSAERCWASSLAVRSEEGGRTTGGGVIKNRGRERWSPGKVRSVSIKRLRKAVGYAALLEALANGSDIIGHGTDDSPTDDVISTDGYGDGTTGDEKNGSGAVGASGGGMMTTTSDSTAPRRRPSVDEHTRMEIRAYASWMRGNLAFERNRWTDACREYRAALDACESIAASASSSPSSSSSANDDGGRTARGDVDGMAYDDGNYGEDDVMRLELFDFFTTRARNVIGPLLRYCQYELREMGMSSTDMTSSLDPIQFKLHSLGTTTPQIQGTGESSMLHVDFRENSIGIDTKEMRMAMLKVQDSKADWERHVAHNGKSGTTGGRNGGGNDVGGDDGSDAKFMTLLSGYDDAISVVNQELKQLAALKSGPAVNAKKFRLVNIIGYCKYQKLRMVMCRNEDLANNILDRANDESGVGMTLKNLEELTHLYDALVQDARAVASLPGGGSPEDFDGDASTAATAVEDEFLLEANANVLRLRSLRCYYLARMHASPFVRKYAEALSLLDHAESLAREAVEEIGACDRMEGGAGLLEKLEGILMDMRGEKCRVLAASYLNTNASSTSVKCLLDRLHDYDIPSASAPLCHVPPKLEPIACKPSFFDVAYNYVSDYPVEGLRRALEERGDGAATTPRKSLLSWFRA